MKLSDQALGALMMALQKSLLEQSDIVPVLRDMNFQVDENEKLMVLNPPNFKIDQNQEINEDSNIDNFETIGSD